VLRAFNVGSRACQEQVVAVGTNADSQTLLELREVLIELSEEPDAIYQIA
jgi:hypothetical protein